MGDDDDDDDDDYNNAYDDDDDDGDDNFQEPQCLPATAAGQRSSWLWNRVKLNLIS